MTSTRHALALAALLTCLSPVAPTAASLPRGPAATTGLPAAVARASADDHVDRVLVISVDGLNPRAITSQGPARLPHLHRLLREGVGTLNARTAVESTSTLPNHASMLTSRRVAARARGHGVWFNHDKTGTTVHRAAGQYVASVFDVVHDHAGSTALYTSKDKFALFDRTWDAVHGAVDVTGADDGRDKIDDFRYSEDEDELVDELVAGLLRDPATFSFLHLSDTDKEGHETGYMGAGYLAAVRTADARLGRILRAVDDSAALRRHLAVVLTSDHGGRGTDHRDARRLVNYRVPFVVWGSRVTRGDLYARSGRARTDPGRSRPGYGAGARPVRNGEVANLVTDLLDLPAVPGSQVNTRQTLRVFAG